MESTLNMTSGMDHSLFFGIWISNHSSTVGQYFLYWNSLLVCWKLTEYIYSDNGTPLQYSCLENPMDGGAWWAAVHGVAKSRTWLSDFTLTFHFHALEKGMAIHSSVLTWRIPGTGEPGGLPSMGSHRARHDWSDLAYIYIYIYIYISVCSILFHYVLFCPYASAILSWLLQFHNKYWSQIEQISFICFSILKLFWLPFFFFFFNLNQSQTNTLKSH